MTSKSRSVLRESRTTRSSASITSSMYSSAKDSCRKADRNPCRRELIPPASGNFTETPVRNQQSPEPLFVPTRPSNPQHRPPILLQIHLPFDIPSSQHEVHRSSLFPLRAILLQQLHHLEK